MMCRRLLPLLVVLLAGCFEQPYRESASGAEAIAAGELQRGWWPAWMSASAWNVHLQGDLDSNEWWLRAELSPASADSLRALLTPVDAGSVRVQRPWRGGGWWFEALIQQAPSNDNALNARLFRGARAPVPYTTVVAFDNGSETVFVWTHGTRVYGP
ncbi:hypothetical protein [Longimicrobium sp.]|uniref:hypothetical protein n=1 Tax=Longimicrobium sp. TaxID=2029185 RepID=UPI002EDAD7F6